MKNIYYQPAAFGLGSFGSIDFCDDYGFNLTVVWQDEAGRFLFGDDSGCSCPTPFEDWGRDDLTEIKSLGDFAEHLKARHLWHDDAGFDSRGPLIAELLERLYKAGLR